MNFYENILVSIVARDLRYKNQFFPDVVYFITGMEKYSEEKGVIYYHSLKMQLFSWDQIDQDEANGEFLADLCDRMIKTLNEKYFIALTEGKNVSIEAEHTDMLRNHWSFEHYKSNSAEPEKPEPRLMQIRLLHFYFSLGEGQVATYDQLLDYAKKHNPLNPASFKTSYYKHLKGNELKFTPYFRISDFEAVVILLKDYKVLQEKAQQALETWKKTL